MVPDWLAAGNSVVSAWQPTIANHARWIAALRSP